MKPVPKGSTREYEELKRWAKQTEFPRPLPWAQLEARVLAERAPSGEELAGFTPSSLGIQIAVAIVLSPLWVAALAVVPLGGVTGLGFVVAHVRFDREPPGEELLALLFYAIIILAAVPVLMWLTERRRGRVALALSGGTALASAGSWALLDSAPLYQRAGVWDSLQSLAAIAVVVGAASFVFLLVAGKPGPRLTWREQLRRVSPEERWMRGMRAGVLEQLVKRDLVASADLMSIVSMPRGTWSELESLPDGRVVRRRP